MLLETLIVNGVNHDVLEQIVMVKSAHAADLYCAVNAMKHQVVDSPAYRVTSMALEERLYQTVDLALLALQPTMDSDVIAVIRAGINTRDSRFNASACEAMQCLKSKNFMHLLTGLVSRDYNVTVKSSTSRVFNGIADVYKWCLQQSDPWIHDCGAYAYREITEQTL